MYLNILKKFDLKYIKKNKGKIYIKINLRIIKYIDIK